MSSDFFVNSFHKFVFVWFLCEHEFICIQNPSDIHYHGWTEAVDAVGLSGCSWSRAPSQIDRIMNSNKHQDIFI